MIAIYLIGADGALQPVNVDELPALMNRPAGHEHTLWVDLNDPTPEEEDHVLKDAFDFHQLAIFDCRQDRLTPQHGDHLPKVEDYGRYLFAIINAVIIDSESDVHLLISTRQINAFIGKDFIVTHHYEPSPAITSTEDLCRKNPMVLRRGPDYIYHLILDTLVDQFSLLLDMFDEEIENLEDEVFHDVTQKTLAKILGLKHEVFHLRRITTYQREMVYRLSRGEFDLVTEQEVAYYRNVYDHLVRAAELTESYRDDLTGLVNAYLSMTSNRMNEIMKVLTLFSTFFLPLTFIVGLYGMNFEHMPELHWAYGYFVVWVLMGLVSVLMFLFFRRRKWL